MKAGRLFVISGPSAVGKGTLCELLLKECPELVLSISATTRTPRKGEKEGISYYFKTEEEFKMMLSKDEFLEHAMVHDHYYGTPKAFVEKHERRGESVLLEIETQGGLQVKKNKSDAVLIFIAPPSKEALIERFQTRGTETQIQIEKRINNAKIEYGNRVYYDYIVVNDHLETALEDLKAIVRAEKHRNLEQIKQK